MLPMEAVKIRQLQKKVQRFILKQKKVENRPPYLVRRKTNKEFFFAFVQGATLICIYIYMYPLEYCVSRAAPYWLLQVETLRDTVSILALQTLFGKRLRGAGRSAAKNPREKGTDQSRPREPKPPSVRKSARSAMAPSAEQQHKKSSGNKRYTGGDNREGGKFGEFSGHGNVDGGEEGGGGDESGDAPFRNTARGGRGFQDKLASSDTRGFGEGSERLDRGRVGGSGVERSSRRAAARGHRGKGSREGGLEGEDECPGEVNERRVFQVQGPE